MTKRTSRRLAESELRPQDVSAIPAELRDSIHSHDAFGVVQDITGLRRTAEALTLFRSLVDYTTDAIEVIDPDSGRFLDVNRRACAAHGYTREEYLTLGVSDIDPLVAERSWEETREEMRRAGDGVFETQHRRKDGSVFPVEVNVTFVRLDRDYLIAVVRDITERKRAEAALTESHSLFRAVVEGTSDAVYVKDLDGRYLLINAAGTRFLGATEAEVIGKRASELLTPEDADAVAAHDRQVTTSGASETFEERVTAGGVTRTFVSTKSVYRDARGDAIGVIGISSEVTDLKRLETRLWQAQKMEAAGRLAGGVAHDFNNLLTVITGYAFMLRQALPADSEACGDVEQVLSAAERGADLTRQLLAFSRRQRLQPQVIDLGQPVAAVSGMLRRVIGEDITLQTEIAPNAWPVLADPGQLEQVVMNLALNARDAMPQGGTLRLRTANVEIDGAAARDRPELPTGHYAALFVEDTGAGIAPAALPRLFEPFFTTKEQGKGTGLGLATVYGIVKQSGGFVFVDSALGRGSRFSVFLPRHEPRDEPRRERPSLKAAAPAVSAPARGAETILLVEDEVGVRVAVRRMLERQGYRVVAVADGAQAIEHLAESEARGRSIDLVLSDVVMPEQGGRALGEALAARWPGQRLLYMTGYTEDEILRRGLAARGAGVLEKPFTPARLAEAVRRALDLPGPAGC
jgi:PAS domain S-box-containing protein